MPDDHTATIRNKIYKTLKQHLALEMRKTTPHHNKTPLFVAKCNKYKVSDYLACFGIKSLFNNVLQEALKSIQRKLTEDETLMELI